MTCPICNHPNHPHQLLCSNCQHVLQSARLRVLSHDQDERTLELAQQDFTIGRNPDNDLVLANESVSRHHVRLRFTEGGYAVEDLNSKNGLMVNGERVKTKTLEHQDCIQIGANWIYFCLTGSAVSNRTAPSSVNAITTRSDEGQGRPAGAMAEILFEGLLYRVLHGTLQLTQSRCATLWLPDSTGDLIPRMQVARDANAPPQFFSRCPFPTPPESDHENLAVKVFQSGATIVHPMIDATATFWENLQLDSALEFQLLGIPIRTDSKDGVFLSAPSESISPAGLHDRQGPLAALILQREGTAPVLDHHHVDRLNHFLAQAGPLLARGLWEIALVKRMATKAVDGGASETELEIAAQIQQRLFPAHAPNISGYDFAHWLQPAGLVCGDYLDMIPLNDAELAIALGDVADRGLQAALLLSSLQACLRLHLCYESRPESLLGALNELMHAAGSAFSFTTFFLAILNHRHGVMRYANAGHNPGLLITKHGDNPRLELLRSNGAALGVLESNCMNEQFVFFPAGSTLALYTDGVTEARDPEGRQYGLGRLAERAVTEALTTPALSASHLLHTLRADLPNNLPTSSRDDQAILIIAAR